jgi:hypothetical protein
MRPTAFAAAILLVLASSVQSSADATAFVGSSMSPVNRAASGFAVGAGLLFLGFEFEYASTREDAPAAAAALRTAVGNVLIQTPLPIAGVQPYFTTGAGLYRERVGAAATTSVALDSGGGVKVTLAGALRARFDYRVFRLSGQPRTPVVHRVYAGLNVAF